MMDDPVGGDPVCWLNRLCPECRAMPTEDDPTHCWRCGAPLERTPDPDQPGVG